jgi:hypothetical protein
MARRIAYTGDPVITLAEVAYQCRLDPEDLQPELIEHVVIPGVTGMAEAITGAAIRQAEYEDEWPEHFGSGHPLDQGQAFEVLSVSRVHENGEVLVLDVDTSLRQSSRESFLHFPAGRPPGVLSIRYLAGVSLEAYPSVKIWLLMQAAAAHELRETMIVGTILTALPARFLGSLLSEIEVPPRF